MSPIWFIPGIVGQGLELLVIAAMRKTQAYRRYPLVFIYCLLLFLVATVEWAAALPSGLALASTPQYIAFYWINETVIQLVTFLLMIQMIYRAMEGVPTRATTCAALTVGALVATGLFVVTSPIGKNSWSWMTLFSRNLSFCSALLNVTLWTALLRQRKRDRQLLMVSAGLGLQTTGKAIGHSIRSFASLRSPAAAAVGNVIIVITGLLALFLYWRSFKRTQPAPQSGATPRMRPDDESVPRVAGSSSFSALSDRD